jgi:hypothetical protein
MSCGVCSDLESERSGRGICSVVAVVSNGADRGDAQGQRTHADDTCYDGAAKDGEGNAERRAGAAAFEKHEPRLKSNWHARTIFEEIEEQPQGKKVPAIDGIIDDGKEIISGYKVSPASMLAWFPPLNRRTLRDMPLTTWAEELASRLP